MSICIRHTPAPQHGSVRHAPLLRLTTSYGLAAAMACTAAAGVPTANLIANSGAENGAASNNGNTVVPVPSWTTSGTFTVVPYALGGGFPLATDPGPADRGLNFFAGGPGAPESAATQTIDLTPFAAAIDADAAAFTLSGYLGGFDNQNDRAQLAAVFLATGGSALGTASVGPVTATERNNLTGLLARSSTGPVPPGTRSVTLTLTMTRASGSYNDGYADNLSLTLELSPAGCLGDADCDGDVDFFDIDPFVAKLGCPSAGPDCDAACPWQNADVDQDGDVDFFDIDPFVSVLGTTCP